MDIFLILIGVTAKQKYEMHAKEYEHLANYQDYLAKDSEIPSDMNQAVQEVETWGKDYPHDPRTHLYWAIRLLSEHNQESTELATQELETALTEAYIRFYLSNIFLEQDEKEKAQEIARPMCNRFKEELTQDIFDSGLCKKWLNS